MSATDRHFQAALDTLTCNAFIIYCQARLDGSSHIYAMALANRNR